MINPSIPNSEAAALERFLLDLVPETPRSLYDPVRYLLEAGGKRVRPTLTYLVAQLGDSPQNWMPPAAAAELLHTFTLVHDDIMDHAATRRGRPTVHEHFGDSAAILSGDVMIALATEALTRSISSSGDQLLKEFSWGFKKVCEGQALDKDFETATAISIEDYLHMIDLKTAKVLEMSAVLGAVASGAQEYTEVIRSFAHHIGIAFQIQDDLLDLTAASPQFGKMIGGDILEGKRTYLLLSALEQRARLSTTDNQLLERVQAGAAVVDDIVHCRELFHRLGVLQRTEAAIASETEKAAEVLRSINHEQAATLQVFAQHLLRRAH